ncbi:MAG TPA: protein kinase [Pirellulales bacterium]|nr:protein kinase [Pirellulales bacterium]
MLDYDNDEKAIFLAALEQSTACEREAYLRSACGDDPELLKRVKVLLSVHEQSHGPLDAPSPGVGVAPTLERPIAERPGTVIGPYKLLEQIGEGGFGVVFMAEQQQPVRRKVALKVLKPGMDTRQVVARFEAERQALALMDHPNIAHIFDGGTVGQAFQPDSDPARQAGQPELLGQAGKPDLHCGRPYFVMELVRGIPITEFCDESCLGIRRRLELFVDVCQAVQHAHQKGIIHRDIKPSNVMVTLHDGQPVVKVIDFGIAKAMGQQLTEKTLFTNFAQMIGTPLYMSPEQAELSGLDMDTRSDIYSLGVLLYELLTGTTPFESERLSKVGYDEMRRIIREEEPPKPSTRMSTVGKAASTASQQRASDPRKLSRLFRGELDWIVMKALEKDRNRRYETATGFALDVKHYLNDEQVVACPPSAHYRLRTLLKRHRGPAAAVCAVLAVLVGGIAATSVGFLSARAAQRRAEENFEIAHSAVDDYLNRVTEDPDLKRSDFNALRKKLLESAVPFYQRLVERKPRDAAQEAARGRAYGRLGTVQQQIGETAGALADLEQMRSIFAKLAADFPAAPEYHSQLAASHFGLGNVLFSLGRNDEADSAYRDALAIQKKLAAESPTVSEYRENLAKTHNASGVLLARLGKRDEAEVAFRAALAIHEKLAADFPTVPDYRWGLAAARTNLGTAMKQEGKHDEAEAAYRAALRVLEKLAADFPAVPTYRHNLAMTRNNLASVLDDQGKLAEAEAACRAALPVKEKLAADFPTVPEYRRGLAGSWQNLGWILIGLGKDDEAEAAWRAALVILEKLAADFPTIPKYREELAVTRQNLARTHLRKGERDEAAATLSRAMELDATDHFSAYQLGFLLAEQGDLPAYQKYCHTMLSRWGNATDSAEQTAKACLLLAGGVSDPAQLAPLVQTALSVGARHEAYPWFLFAQGLHDYRCGRFAEARTACADSRQRAASHPELIVINQVVEAMSLYRLGKTDEARQALAAADRLLVDTTPDFGSGDLGPSWHDWLGCRILRREAEELLNHPTTETGP